MAPRSRSVASILAAVILAAHVAPALAAPGDELLAAAGVYQKTAAKSCLIGGIGLPPPCVLSFPPPPAGRILEVLEMSCLIQLPVNARAPDVTMSAANQPSQGIGLRKIGDFFGKTRYRTEAAPALFVPAGQTTVAIQMPVLGGTVDASCGIVGRLRSP